MSVTAVLHPDGQKFPAGTTVKAYKRSNWHGLPGQPSGAPEGSQDASATVAADGSVTFTGLVAQTDYLLYAATPDRYSNFSTKTTSEGASVYTGTQDFSGATVTLPSGLIVPADSVDSAAIQANAVGSSELADDAVDTNAIQNLAVTTGKLAANAVTTAKITDANITAAKLAADALTSRGVRRLVAPMGFGLHQLTASANPTSLQPRGCRVIVPESGQLRDFAVPIATSSGNLSVAVYDTGDTTAGQRTKLWDSGSVASPGTGWRIIGDPNIAVVAGQQLDFVICVDNGTLAVARALVTNSNFSRLPTGFGAVPGGALPTHAFDYLALGTVAAWTSTVADASIGPTTLFLPMIARIS